MNSPPPTLQSVAVIGGGISGLAAAHRLTEIAPGLQVRLFEAGPKLGGVLETEYRDGFQIELGSDSFITNKPGAVELCERIGFADELVTTNDQFRKTLIVHQGQLRQLPQGFLLMAPSQLWSVLTTPILSLKGKLRLAWEFFLPPRKQTGEESIAQFARRRLGREAYDRIVQPLVGGIYTGDSEKLSLEATLPRFVRMEQECGGLIRGAWRETRHNRRERASSGARYSLFVTPRRGLASLVQAVAERLPPDCVSLNAPVSSLSREGDLWRVAFDSDREPETFDAVILALPAGAASRITRELDAELSRRLAEIPYAGAAVISLGYEREQIKHPLDAFGFVVPEVENRRILAASFSSVKFPDRAPKDKVLLRAFVGGAKQPEMLELSDAEMEAVVQEELDALLGVRGLPLFCCVGRYLDKMPQYHLGHRQRVEAIESRAAALPGLQLAGNAYHGVGIPDCITSGEQAAQQLVAQNPANPAAEKAE